MKGIKVAVGSARHRVSCGRCLIPSGEGCRARYRDARRDLQPQAFDALRRRSTALTAEKWRAPTTLAVDDRRRLSVWLAPFGCAWTDSVACRSLKYQAVLFEYLTCVGAPNDVCATSRRVLLAVSTCVLLESCARHCSRRTSSCAATQLYQAKQIRKPHLFHASCFRVGSMSHIHHLRSS